MKLLNQDERPGIQWEVMDACQMIYDEQTFDLVIDKGTLDAVLCGD
jgi:hypothetical protein